MVVAGSKSYGQSWARHHGLEILASLPLGWSWLEDPCGLAYGFMTSEMLEFPVSSALKFCPSVSTPRQWTSMTGLVAYGLSLVAFGASSRVRKLPRSQDWHFDFVDVSYKTDIKASILRVGIGFHTYVDT